jgi:hypothetical protein
VVRCATRCGLRPPQARRTPHRRGTHLLSREERYIPPPQLSIPFLLLFPPSKSSRCTRYTATFIGAACKPV